MAPDPAGDLAHPDVLRLEDRDLLTLVESEVPAAERGKIHRWHPATVPEPPAPRSRRHPDRGCGLLSE